MTEETDQTKIQNPIDANLGENLGTDITSGTVPVSLETYVTVPTVIIPPAIPTKVKETFLQRAETDVEEAYHWLLTEIHKIYTAL